MIEYYIEGETGLEGVGEQEYPKFEVVVLPDARTNPGTVVVKLPHAFPTHVAMFRTILLPAITN